jgi:hypothetical protein
LHPKMTAEVIQTGVSGKSADYSRTRNMPARNGEAAQTEGVGANDGYSTAEVVPIDAADRTAGNSGIPTMPARKDEVVENGEADRIAGGTYGLC